MWNRMVSWPVPLTGKELRFKYKVTCIGSPHERAQGLGDSYTNTNRKARHSSPSSTHLAWPCTRSLLTPGPELNIECSFSGRVLFSYKHILIRGQPPRWTSRDLWPSFAQTCPLPGSEPFHGREGSFVGWWETGCTCCAMCHW